MTRAPRWPLAIAATCIVAAGIADAAVYALAPSTPALYGEIALRVVAAMALLCVGGLGWRLGRER